MVLHRTCKGGKQPQWTLLLSGMGLLIVLGTTRLWVHRPVVALNLTASLPRGLYRIVSPHRPFTRGDIALIDLPRPVRLLVVGRRWILQDTSLLKPVAGLPGETVCVHHHAVHIAGRYVAPLYTTDRQGLPLPRPLQGCNTLGTDELFLASTYAATSFDSRYFGPVNVTAIKGWAIPLLTW